MALEQPISANGCITSFLVVLNGIIVKEAYTGNDDLYWALLITLPLLLFAIYNATIKDQ